MAANNTKDLELPSDMRDWSPQNVNEWFVWAADKIGVPLKTLKISHVLDLKGIITSINIDSTILI